MPWVKLDDRFPSHRKIALLSDRAFRLHVSALCWCAENLTDGHITDRELPLVAKIRGMKATAKALEDAGLWDRVEGGWIVHDYLDYNPSREQVLAERKKNAERQERHRRRRNGKPLPPDSSQTPETHDGDTNAARPRHDGDMTATGNRPVSETYQQVSEFRNGVTNDAPTRPVPTRPSDMAEVGGGSTGSGGLPAQRPDGLSPHNPSPATAQTIVGEWIDRCAKRPPSQTIGQASKQIKKLLDEGIDADDIRRGLARWMAKGSAPSAIPSFVNEAMNAGPRPSNVVALPTGQTLTGTDAKCAGWSAVTAQLRALENRETS